jgi:DNA-binding NarL/FixJ family response regulator
MTVLQNETGPLLAILDWVMQGPSGHDVCRRIRESGKLAYILLLTARSGKQDITDRLRAGAPMTTSSSASARKNFTSVLVSGYAFLFWKLSSRSEQPCASGQRTNEIRLALAIEAWEATKGVPTVRVRRALFS